MKDLTEKDLVGLGHKCGKPTTDTRGIVTDEKTVIALSVYMADLEDKLAEYKAHVYKVCGFHPVVESDDGNYGGAMVYAIESLKEAFPILEDQ